MLDEFNVKIIDLLKKDSRTSYAEIGRKIHLSPSSVRERVQYLIDIGLIKKFSIEIDPVQLGYELQAFILIKLFSGKLKNFISIVNQFKEVQQSFRITGNQNVLLKVLFKDQKHLQNFLDLIMVYGDTTTYMVLSEIDE
jgi:Lrp/AsnC family leucine-responsive transcriptional regulator